MTRRRIVLSMRALALALLLLLVCIFEGSSAFAAMKRHNGKKPRRPKRHHSRGHRPKQPIRGKIVSKAVSSSSKFVGFNLGDGCSLSVAELGNYAASIGVTRLKLFHTVAEDIAALSSFEVMAGIQNYQLQFFADPVKGYTNMLDYVNKNILPNPHVYSIAVGNEPFGTWHNKEFDGLIMPSILNLDKALRSVGLGGKVELVVPLDFASMYRDDFPGIVAPILEFLQSTRSPFVVNLYPEWPCKNEKVDINFCLGNNADASLPGKPASMLQAQVAELFKLLDKLGYGGLEVQVGETGWPTGDGHPLSTPENQEAFLNNVLKYVNNGGVSTYIFQLQDGHSDSYGLLENPSGKPKINIPRFF